jgi:hypothetical protein
MTGRQESAQAAELRNLRDSLNIRSDEWLELAQNMLRDERRRRMI